MSTLKGNWRKYINTKYLAGEDFDRVITLTIKDVVREDVFDPNSSSTDTLLILKFEETEKGVIVNKERGREIERITGTKEVSEWVGAKIPFYGKPHRRFGKVVAIKKDYSNIKPIKG